MTAAHSSSAIDLYWIPLGADGTGFVRMNGRIYEAWRARREHRPALDLFHTALEVSVPRGRFVVETMWPRPDRDGSSRGVVLTGPVFAPSLGRLRTFSYEVRRWSDGVLPDAGRAVGGPRRIGDGRSATRLLDLVGQVPPLVWGREVPGVGDWWNSNSVISWLLCRSGVPVEAVRPPSTGRAPGWDAGIAVARLGLS